MKLPVLSNKVSVGTLTGMITMGLTWALTYFIPAWHHGIPAALAPLIPGAAGVIAGLVAGYLARHKATASELEVAFQDAEKVLALLGVAFPKSSPPPVGPSEGQLPSGGGTH